MPVSFLELIPQPLTATVAIATAAGPQEIEFSGVSLHALGEISRRFPGFAKILDGGMLSLIDNSEPLAAFFAASLGHLGEPEYEARFSAVPAGDMLRIWRTVMRLTFPPDEDPDPLSGRAVGNGAAGAEPVPNLSSQLSS